MEYNKIILSNLVAMAQVDGVVKEKEIQTLYKLGNKYGFSKANVDNAVKSMTIPSYFDHANVSISNDSSKVFDIIRIAISDGEIHEKEEVLLMKLLQPYGYTKVEIDELIEIAKLELKNYPSVR